MNSIKSPVTNDVREGGQNREKALRATYKERLEILDRLPQKGAFRFIDTIYELSTEHIIAGYYFTGREWFYSGHFPGHPVTPGAILLESMAQASLVALGIYIVSTEDPTSRLKTLFSDCHVEFLKIIPPQTRISIRGEKIYFRRNKLKSKVELTLEDGTLAAFGTMSGVGMEERDE